MAIERTIDELNVIVTEKIKKVQEAQAELASAELDVAYATDPNSVEGQVARRGAITAARQAGLDDWTHSILQSFLSEEVSEEFGRELKALASA